jgi:hypothetical protein
VPCFLIRKFSIQIHLHCLSLIFVRHVASSRSAERIRKSRAADFLLILNQIIIKLKLSNLVIKTFSSSSVADFRFLVTSRTSFPFYFLCSDKVVELNYDDTRHIWKLSNTNWNVAEHALKTLRNLLDTSVKWKEKCLQATYKQYLYILLVRR